MPPSAKNSNRLLGPGADSPMAAFEASFELGPLTYDRSMS